MWTRFESGGLTSCLPPASSHFTRFPLMICDNRVGWEGLPIEDYCENKAAPLHAKFSSKGSKSTCSLKRASVNNTHTAVKTRNSLPLSCTQHIFVIIVNVRGVVGVCFLIDKDELRTFTVGDFLCPLIG
jgi:hypothetical protein